jgi:hypothetical protein
MMYSTSIPFQSTLCWLLGNGDENRERIHTERAQLCYPARFPGFKRHKCSMILVVQQPGHLMSLDWDAFQ